MYVENEASFLAALRNGINLFAGAGFSIESKNDMGRMPVGGELADELREKFNLQNLDTLDLPKLHTIINATKSAELDHYLRQRFNVASFDARYKMICYFAFKSIFTTNIDNLFQCIFSANDQKYLNDVYQRGSASGIREAVDLIQLHGSITDHERPFTFSTLDLAAASSVDPDRWNLLRQRLAENPTIYWGYSLSDAGTLETLRSSTGPNSTVGDAWIQIRPDSVGTGIADYFRALNLQIIEAETSELLEYLSSHGNDKPLSVTPASRDLENIPSATDVVLRPIEDFFRGAAPLWSDVYNRSVGQAAPYRRIANNVAAGKNTVLAGIPACGKTTLLMQIAALLDFDGPKLMYNAIEAPQAQFIRRQIGDGKALLILDNFAAGIDAFKIFSSAPNISIVAADRDYNISTITHLLKGEVVDIIGISEAVETDLTMVWRSIPARMRKRTQQKPKTIRGVRPTISEFVRSNITGRSLDDRIVDYIKDIREQDVDQATMIVLACYLHRSGAPLSMDVAIAFFRENITDFGSLYDMMKVVGDILHEYDDDDWDSDQDYFAARSNSLAENVIEGVPGSLLRQVLINFHENVSPLRISSYDVFKRKGYDSKVFSKAFHKWREGADLYDQIYEKTNNLFVLQQKGLFLSSKGIYDEAFHSIEKARGLYRGKPNWSIENSYNVILFHSNIYKASAHDEAFEICSRALKGIAACFRHDTRKGRHALAYAGLALRLSKEIVSDMNLVNLQLAEEMLEKAKELEEWYTGIKYSLKDVRTRITELS